MNDPKVQNNAPAQEPASPKKPYDKPEVIYCAPLEATAGQCTPAPGKTESLSCTIITS